MCRFRLTSTQYSSAPAVIPARHAGRINWDGASVGTVVSIWLSHILQERDHTMVSVRDWAAERVQTIQRLLDLDLRPTDCTDDRLARILTMLGDPATQAALDAALLQRWIRVYCLPTATVRLDSTSVSVYHDDVPADRLLQHGWSVVQTALSAQELPDGTVAWVVAAVWVDWAAWQAMEGRLGWQVYVTNTTPAEYAVPALVAAYHQQPIHERSFSRLKTRNLQLRPVFVRDETRISGLVWLLCLALRVRVLTEQRLRSAIQTQGRALVGLNPASRTQATTTPTSERAIRAFRNLTVTVVTGAGWEQRHGTSLNDTQQQIVDLLGLPSDLYARLGGTAANLPP